MSVWGIGVRTERGRPLVTIVEAATSGDGLRGREVLRHRCAEDDFAAALVQIAADVEHELSKGAPDVVAIRAMDFYPGRALSNATRQRLQVEGVLLHVARMRVAIVRVLNGQEIGHLYGSPKDAVEGDAGRLLPGLDLDAAVAAMGGLRLVRP